MMSWIVEVVEQISDRILSLTRQVVDVWQVLEFQTWEYQW